MADWQKFHMLRELWTLLEVRCAQAQRTASLDGPVHKQRAGVPRWGGVAPEVDAMDAADLDSTHAHLLASYTSKPPLPNSPFLHPLSSLPFKKLKPSCGGDSARGPGNERLSTAVALAREAPPQRAVSHGGSTTLCGRGERGGADDDQLASQTSAVAPSPWMPGLLPRTPDAP